MAVKEHPAGSEPSEPVISMDGSQDAAEVQPVVSLPTAALGPSWCFTMCPETWDWCPHLIPF